ncbi:MAG: hypothetical protein WCI04_04865 [archaeon]
MAALDAFEGKWNQKPLVRDKRGIRLANQGMLVVKDHVVGHIEANKLFHFLKKNSAQKNYSIVPVKGVVVPKNEWNVDGQRVIQKYFERPSLGELLNYLDSLEAVRKKRMTPLRAEQFVGSPGFSYCERLLQKNPALSENVIMGAGDELRSDFKKSPQSRYAFFSFSNYLVFGADSKGRPKIGVIDL